jgi:hypothetical protein
MVDLVVNPTPTIACISNGTKNYLIGEYANVNGAWGPFVGTTTRYLYWEISKATGRLSRSSTTLSPVIAPAAPLAPQINQMWWNTLENSMYNWSGNSWVNVLRVLAGTLLNGSVLQPATYSSQVSLTTPAEAGFIMTDGLGSAFKNSAGDFLTTDTDLTSISTGSLVKLDGAQIIVQANEAIPRFSLVYLLGGRASLASGIPPDNETKVPVALITQSAAQNEPVTLNVGGRLVVNEQWNWTPAQIGKTVYCGAAGQITANKPPSLKNMRVGVIMSSNSVLLRFDWETESMSAFSGSSGVMSVLAAAPLTITGTLSNPIVNIQRADTSTDGYIAATDMLRLTAVETGLASKSNIGHTHNIGGVIGLQTSLDGKAPTVHYHVIDDTTGLQLALDGKALTVHSHAIADVTGLQTLLNGKAASIHTHIIADTTGLLAILDGKAPIVHNHAIANVTGLQAILDSLSPTAHTHAIADIAGLQLTLDSKALAVHSHAIADVTGLQLALDSKAALVHTHAIADTPGLQLALDSKSATGHTHALDNLSDVNATAPASNEVLTWSGTEWIAQAIPAAATFTPTLISTTTILGV